MNTIREGRRTVQRIPARWRVVLIGALALGLATAGTWVFAGMSIVRDGPRAEGSDQTAGLWTGTVQQKVSRSSGWFALSYMAQGDFWLRIDEEGNAHGHAVMAYQPDFDTAGADAVINYLKNVGNLGLGLFGLPGVAVGGDFNRLVGVTSENAEAMPVREGPVTGRLAHGELSLRWAGEEPEGIPYKISLAYVDSKEVLVDETFPVQEPWPASATVVDGAGRQIAIASDQQDMSDGDVTTTLSTYWSAHRTR